MNSNYKAILTFILTIALSQMLVGQQSITIRPNSADGKDARIQNNLPNTNVGTSQLLRANAGTTNGVSTIDRSLISFDIVNNLPDNIFIANARLSLFSNTVLNGHRRDDELNNAYIERIIEPWDELGVTWNNQPATSPENRVLIPASESFDQNYLDINITNLIRDIYNNPVEGYGLMIKLRTEVEFRNLDFASSDASDSEIHPMIIIDYYQTGNCIKISRDTKDARIQSNLPNDNIELSQFFTAGSGTINGATFIDRSLIDFQVASLIPEHVIITNASLSLYSNSLVGGHRFDDFSNQSWLERITEPWEENTVTWNNQPLSAEENRVFIETSETNDEDYLNIDVTSLIQDIYNDPINSHGFMIKLIEENEQRLMVFASSDVDNQELSPSLHVCYTLMTGNDEPLERFQQINLFPNPIVNSLTVKWEIANINFVKLSEISGKLLQQINVEGRTETKLQLKGIQPGIYSVLLIGDFGNFSRKIIKI